ncbi:family 16 glycosylhydrolase [Deinococcus yunweiensis]|uniref:family 16 glycosylhydrolase n=1 Tax=Deinococcus yunweiensis TaxID=367282 RepID=UPI00398EBDF8
MRTRLTTLILGVVTVLLGTGAAPQPTPEGAWRDDFTTLNRDRWLVSSGWTPFWVRGPLSGTWAPEHVQVRGGLLRLRLTVDAQGVSRAAELATRQVYGHGTYTARLRAAGPARSGSISAFFNYVNDSATELDVELPGDALQALWTSVYRTVPVVRQRRTETGRNLSTGFHTYSWEWTPQRVRFSVDGRVVHEVTDVVPTQAAHVMFNVWPSDSDFGGAWRPGERTMLVDGVSYKPLR